MRAPLGAVCATLLVGCSSGTVVATPSSTEPQIGLRVHNQRVEGIVVSIPGLPDATVGACSTKVVPYPDQPAKVVLRGTKSGVILTTSTPPPLGGGVEAFSNADVTNMAPADSAGDGGGPFHSIECLAAERSADPAP
jgi:hypothetical protein